MGLILHDSPKMKRGDLMSAEKLFDAFYAVPNPHFNAFFEASTGGSDAHPLADLVAAEPVGEPSGPIAGNGEPAEEK